ncbi:MAG: hypothetical protein FJ398_22770 [Verrucomicrobia bacterium]|nr:hypothetical protein [Verrucomicrobiota bacterium]
MKVPSWEGKEWVHGPNARFGNRDCSHEPNGRASLSPASPVARVPSTSSGSPGRTRPTWFMKQGTLPSTRERLGLRQSSLLRTRILPAGIPT